MMNLLRTLVALALFVTFSVVSADETATEINCGKDCADFVATAVKHEKTTLETELLKCQNANDELKKEHDETVASLKTELAQLQGHTEKAAQLEKQLKDLSKEIEKKYAGEIEQQKAMLKQAYELAKKSQQEVIEAKMEIEHLIESLGSTRINFKLIWDDVVGLWKKVADKFTKKDIDQTKSDL